jgi:hypothetical protein
MTEPNKQNGLRAMGDRDKSPEFKLTRDKLVDDINSWLVGRLEISANFANEPLITETNLGQVNPAVNMVGISRKPGTSMRGNNIETPLQFQKVTINESGEMEVIEVTGTDPVAHMIRDGKYHPDNRQEKVASFGLEVYGLEGQENYFKYEVSGDGLVTQKFITDEGVHTGRALSTVEDIEMARLAFEQVVADVTS